MKCFVCQSPNTFSVNGTAFAGLQIRYVAHAGYGIELIGCRNCEFISVEFLHPKTLDLFYSTANQTMDTEALFLRHTDSCRRQTKVFEANLPKKCRRMLFYGAARSLHVDHYADMAEEIFVCDLVPAFREFAGISKHAKILNETDLNQERFAGTFDLVVLSNVLQRLPFPRSRLSLCSRLLKPGGHLAFEVPMTMAEDVGAGKFAPDEINFFSENTLTALVRTQGSFGVKFLNVDDVARATPSATVVEQPQSNSRKAAQAILVNERPIRTLPPSDIDPGDLGSIMGKLSFACFVAGMSQMTWTDGRPLKPPNIVLDFSAHS